MPRIALSLHAGKTLFVNKWLQAITLFAAGFLLVIQLSGTAAPAIVPPLATQGAKIIDSTKQAVLLRGVNWFGIETDIHVPHGLWVRDYKDMLRQIKGLGYNIIRLPFSVNALRANNISGVDFNIGSNRELQGKTPLQVMDLVIQEAARQGLLILLDSHRLNDYNIPELWYGDGFAEADWINTWTMLAQRYRNQTNVIGADLKNEPHGRASWGTGDQATDWRLAAERAGNAILRVNPNWLIVVEGVEKNVPGQQLPGHWWGGNLEGVRNAPVRLSVANKLVYSPHEYGAGVFNQPWFSDPTFPNNLPTRWEKGFHYIATQAIAPILVGEFGGRQVDSSSKEGIWQRRFVDYIAEKNLSFTYWSWNPNSGDTGGILQDDWRTIHSDKQQLLNKLLTGGFSTPVPTPSPTPTATPTPVPSPSPTTPPSGQAGLRALVNIQSDWQTGFCANFRVTNQGSKATRNWQLRFSMNQAQVTSSWNGTFTRSGSQYTVAVPNWASVLQPGQTIESTGFCATKTGADYRPKQVAAIAL